MGGCRTPAAETRIDIVAPGTFSGVGEVPVDARWWTSLGDVTLENLVDRSLRDNPSLDVVAARLRSARAVVRREGADQAVQVDATASAARSAQRSEREGPNGTSRETESASEYGLGLAASYEVDLWGRLESETRAAELEAAGAREDLAAAAISLTAEVARAWYSLVEARRRIALLDDQLRTNEQVLEVVELRFGQGETGASDVLQQRQLVESVRGDRVRVVAEQAVAWHQLSILLGVAPGLDDAPTGAEFPTLPALPRLGLPSTLIQQRPDLRSAMARLRAADERIAAAVAESYPRVSLGIDAQTAVTHPSMLFEQWLARLAGSLVAPLLDGGARDAQTDVRRAERDEALHAYRGAVLAALAEVEDALAIERQQADLMASLDRQITLARQVTERVRDSYVRGGEDFLRVLTAVLSEQSLERERLTVARARIDARIALHRAIATTVPLPEPARLTTQLSTDEGTR